MCSHACVFASEWLVGKAQCLFRTSLYFVFLVGYSLKDLRAQVRGIMPASCDHFRFASLPFTVGLSGSLL